MSFNLSVSWNPDEGEYYQCVSSLSLPFHSILKLILVQLSAIRAASLSIKVPIFCHKKLVFLLFSCSGPN